MQDSHIFTIALDIVRVTVHFVQGCPEWLAVINLPESDTRFQASVILVIQRHELVQVKALKVVKVPKSKRNTTVFCVSGDVLHFLVKILSKFVLV